MAAPAPHENLPLLPTMAVDAQGRRLAWTVALLSALIFIAFVPYTKVKLAPVSAFIPIYESALLLTDVITAVMLFGHFTILRSRALLVLACSYVLTAALTVSHVLTFPGLFSATGWIGAGAQSTAWIYVFWHAGFPLCVMAYARLNRQHASAPVQRPERAIGIGIAAMLALALAFSALATAGHDLLPPILVGGTYSVAGRVSLGSTWVLCALAFGVLWRDRNRSVLDLWLLVALCAWICDVALSAVLNAGRYDIGWYAGRIYGLLSASCVLIVLLLENNKLYARLAVAHAGALRDMAERKLFITELTQARLHAEQASQAKSTFLASMSHELRTPLNAILGFAQILGDDGLPVAPGKEKEFARHIQAAGRHLLSLINEVLDLAKVESGKMTLALAPVPVGEVLRACHDMTRPLAEQRGIRLTFPPDPGVAVSGDRIRLQQVLLNLLSNAVKYNRAGGAVVVSCAHLAGRKLRIAVQDSGHGLTTGQLAQLYQPFNRLGQETGAEEGSGIGLAVTKQLVELMDGAIGVSSSPGVGSRFWVDLQLAAGA